MAAKRWEEQHYNEGLTANLDCKASLKSFNSPQHCGDGDISAQKETGFWLLQTSVNGGFDRIWLWNILGKKLELQWSLN